jgi:hypothetical protein
MPNKENLWYRVGYALETVRDRLPPPARESAGKPSRGETLSHDVSHKIMDAFLAVGAGSLFTRVFSLLPRRRNPGIFRLLRAGTAGAVAAFLAEAVRPALTGKKPDTPMEEALTDILLTGAGRGLLYAALVEPRIPAPALLQGVAYGSLEYALTPWGGLGELAGSKAPQGKIPALSVLLKDRGTDEQLVEHIAFGVALALLYDR